MIKIISAKEENDMLRLKTDNKDRPEFVYKLHKFNSRSELEAEMSRSLKASMKKTEKEVLKAMKLKKELEEEMEAYEKETKK